MDVNPFASLIDTEALEWIPTGSGNSLKILRVSEETGAWSALIQAKAGTVNARHRHIGPADFLVLSGSIEYRGGVAKAGCWVYEPAGAIHDATTHPEDTVYLANVHGPIAYLDDDDKITHVSDGESMRQLGRKAGVLA
ncbi:MAG TPA: 2,4'-dihydroxyacetophenone dioxygenase family protein [Acidimicrobiales bacterium]|jgi:anti-sigma factor ChrR (cupin superfamily)